MAPNTYEAPHRQAHEPILAGLVGRQAQGGDTLVADQPSVTGRGQPHHDLVGVFVEALGAAE